MAPCRESAARDNDTVQACGRDVEPVASLEMAIRYCSVVSTKQWGLESTNGREERAGNGDGGRQRVYKVDLNRRRE